MSDSLRYILDTDILSMWAIRQEPVYSRVKRSKPNTLAITIVTAEEMLDGWVTRLSTCPRSEFLPLYTSMFRGVNFLKDVTVVPLTEKSLEIYDELRMDYKGKGRHDLLIASIALEHKLKLVTNNVKDFDFIAGLEIENWAK